MIWVMHADGGSVWSWNIKGRYIIPPGFQHAHAASGFIGLAAESKGCGSVACPIRLIVRLGWRFLGGVGTDNLV